VVTASRPQASAPVLAAAALALIPGSALADITVSAARITEGLLWVIGDSDEPNARIVLDDVHEAATDRGGGFEFRVIYHPATCIVTLRTSSESRRAVVANCGQAGPKGEAGPAGPPGPAAVAALPADPPPARAPAQPLAAAQPPAAAQPAAPGPLAARTPDATQSLPSPGSPLSPPPDPPRPRPAPVAVPAAPPGPPVAGEWLDADGKAKINIQPCGGDAVCGKVSWSREGGGIGTQVVNNMKPAGPNRWEGTITNPENGKTYQSSITLQGSSLKVEGCVMGFLCGGQTWTRPR
jgi:hypothetical protein